MSETKENKPQNKDIQENKAMAAISYLWVISLIVLLVKKDSEFTTFHARQGFILFIGSVIIWIVSAIINSILALSFSFGAIAFFGVIWWIIGLIIFIMAIVGLVKAANGEYYKMPVIGDLAEKIKF